MTLNQSDFPAPPIAEVRSDTFAHFGQERVDNYCWLKDKNNPAVIDYLNAENAYTRTVMASTEKLQQNLFDEIVGRIKEDDESYPTFIDGYYYYSRTEKGNNTAPIAVARSRWKLLRRSYSTSTVWPTGNRHSSSVAIQ